MMNHKYKVKEDEKKVNINWCGLFLWDRRKNK